MRAACLLVLAILGCGHEDASVERQDEPGVVNFSAYDPEMTAAIRQARESVDAFIAQLPALRGAGDYFSVKVPINTGSAIEHVWLDTPEFAEDSFHGKLGNVPLAGPFKLGDVITTPRAEISDWMAVRHGELYGGFTMIVVRSRLSPEERAEFEASLGLELPAAARMF